MPTIVVTVAIALVVALAVLVLAVATTRDGTTLVHDVRAARAARRSARRRAEVDPAAGATAPAAAARPHVFAAAHRDLVEAADAEDGLDELLSWSQPADGYLTTGELAERLRGVVRR